MRPIDADALLQQIDGYENRRADQLMREWYFDMVSDFPTISPESLRPHGRRC